MLGGLTKNGNLINGKDSNNFTTSSTKKYLEVSIRSSTILISYDASSTVALTQQ